MVDTVLLEFEGVLVDTRAARRAALMRSLGDDGLTITGAAYDEACAGFPTREAAEAAASASHAQLDATAVDLLALRAERYFAEQLASGVSLSDGARRFVESAAGVARLGIVTRARRRDVEQVLSLADLAGAFEVIVTADDVHAPKPSPEGYELALERLSRRGYARPGTSVALEDSLPGLLAAKTVKLRCVAVGSVPAFRAVHADAHIDSLADVTIHSLGERLDVSARRSA